MGKEIVINRRSNVVHLMIAVPVFKSRNYFNKLHITTGFQHCYDFFCNIRMHAGNQLLPAQLIEDELIVSIPLVPKHERLEDCGSVARNLAVMTEGSDAATGPAEQ